MPPKLEHWIGVGLLVFGFITAIIATSLDYWYYYEAASLFKINVRGYFGLWEACSNASNHSACISWATIVKTGDSDVNIDYIRSCQGIMVIGLILNVIAIAANVFVAITQRPSFIYGVGMKSGLFYGVSAGIFKTKYKTWLLEIGQQGGHLPAGFGLAIVAAVINIICVPSFVHVSERRLALKSNKSQNPI